MGETAFALRMHCVQLNAEDTELGLRLQSPFLAFHSPGLVKVRVEPKQSGLQEALGLTAHSELGCTMSMGHSQPAASYWARPGHREKESSI